MAKRQVQVEGHDCEVDVTLRRGTKSTWEASGEIDGMPVLGVTGSSALKALAEWESVAGSKYRSS